MLEISHSSFISLPDADSERNQFASFERRFILGRRTGCWIALFADSRYRLSVNGAFVAEGPARFVTGAPEFDCYELSKWLKGGENLVRVEVNFFGASSYQTMPDGCPGFIAGGGTADGTVDLSTPGEWLVRAHDAWHSEAPLFSFAQGPVEICDLAVLEAESRDGVLLRAPHTPDPAEQPWGPLSPRSVPYPDYAPVEPEWLQLAGPLEASEIFGFQSFVRGYVRNRHGLPMRRRFATWFFAEEPADVGLECFWSDLQLNGEAVGIDTDTALGNHGQAVLKLRSGWNLLTGELEILTESWAYLLRVQPDGPTPRALPDLGCRAAFCLSPIFDASAPPPPLDPDKTGPPPGWTLDAGGVENVTPARLVAWDRPAAGARREGLAYTQLDEVASFTAAGATWVFCFPQGFHGHPVIEVEGPPGALLDLAYDDWSRDDGCVNLYGSNPFTDAADRFVLSGGRQRVEVFHARGGIFLQVTLRAPTGMDAAPLSVLSVSVRRRTLLAEATMTGGLQTDVSEFDFAWKAALRTLSVSTDEAYTDCPWRERGAYIGDSVVAANVNHLASADLSVAWRTFLNFGRAALPDGQLPACAPAWLRKTHEDFTYLWIVGLRDLWSFSGETQPVEESWPTLQRIWQAPWECHTSGLWNADGRNLFIDWGVRREERKGEANAVINLFRLAALWASAELAEALGRTSESADFEQEAETIRSALLEVLWDDDEGRFHPSRVDTGPGLHANILALRYGVGERERLMHYLTPLLRRNFRQGLERGQFSGHAELYFLSFALPALAEAGAHELAEDLILEHYGFLQSLGHRTLAECFCRAQRGIGSRCHTWSAGGAIYGQRYVLGLRQSQAGVPDQWLLEPRVTDRFQQVEGCRPHPAGLIRVRWQREKDVIIAEVEAPEGVEVTPGTGVRMAELAEL